MSTSTTGIAWTDRTWNPVRGCSRVSPGCEHCYAETLANRFKGPGQPYDGLVKLGKHGPRWTGDVRFVEHALAEPLGWRKPARIFVNSQSDLFHEGFTNEQIAAVFGVMAACPRHTFQVLTKRSDRMREWFEWVATKSTGVLGTWPNIICAVEALRRLEKWQWSTSRAQPWPLPNVHLGVSVENQEYDHRIIDLLETPAAVRFLSVEPLLASVSLRRVAQRRTDSGIGMESWEKTDVLHGAHFTQTWGGPWIWNGLRGPRIDWVIVGGESGPNARPCDVAWIRSVVEQCKAAGVPCFVKQLGARPILDSAANDSGSPPGFVTDEKRQAWIKTIHDRKGADPAEWPEDLRVQEMPR